MSNYTTKTIGMIGAGNMGEAIINGLSTKLAPQQLFLYDIDNKKAESISQNSNINHKTKIEDLINNSDIIILAVKPNIILNLLDDISKYINDKIIISIAAGITIKSIEDRISHKHQIIRVMPNTPSLVGEGISVLSPNSTTTDETIKIAQQIFSTIGKQAVLPESQMDAVTGLSGSGPAYVYTFIQGLIDGGVKMGLSREIATKLAAQTVLGSAKMVLDNNADPISLRGKVTSPGGTTIEGVHVLEKAGFSGIIMDAVETATLKSKKLGEK